MTTIAEDRREVERLYDCGYSPNVIARMTGVDVGRVNRILDRYAAQAGPLTPEVTAPVIEPLRGDVQTQPAKVVRAPAVRKPRRTFQHGTAYGYKVHKKSGTQPCEPCVEANRANAREAWRRKAAKKKAEQAAAQPKDKVRVVYLAPPVQPHTYNEYAVQDAQSGRTTPVSFKTAQLEAAGGATILARVVGAWRTVQIPSEAVS